RAETSASPRPGPEPGSCGLGERVQVDPFQRRMKVRSSLLVVPTAQALLAEVAVTENRRQSAPGLGLATLLQTWPFHRAISVLSSSCSPTAQTSFADTAATDSSAQPSMHWNGTRAQCEPFQCKI